MNYDALIYHENIYDTLIPHKKKTLNYLVFINFASPIYACTSLMHAFRDGMMGPCIRGGLLYFVVLIKKKIFDFFIARAQQ